MYVIDFFLVFVGTNNKKDVYVRVIAPFLISEPLQFSAVHSTD